MHRRHRQPLLRKKEGAVSIDLMAKGGKQYRSKPIQKPSPGLGWVSISNDTVPLAAFPRRS